MGISDRAQSETIGNILLIGVVVIVATIAGAGIIFNLTDGNSVNQQAPLLDVQTNVTATNMSLSHNGGDSVAASDLLVIVSNDTTKKRYSVDSANLTGGDDRYEPGETFERSHGLTGKFIDIVVIVPRQQRSYTVFETAERLPGSAGSGLSTNTGLTWASSSDWDSASSAERVVHEAVGDRSANTLRLGYHSTDTNGRNLTAYWSLDEGETGQATDASGNGYTGQNNGVSSADGVLGTTAYDFDGTGWSEVAGFPDFQRNFSVAGWIRTTDPSVQGQRIFVDDESNTGGYAVSVGDSGNAGSIRFYNRDISPISMDSPSVVQASTWHHITATVDTRAQTRTIYLNGTEIRRDTYTGSWGTDNGPAAIGGETDQGESGNRFAGRIDELRIYNRTLTNADAQRLYETSQNGTFVTGTKQFASPVPAGELTLSNLTVSRPSATDINITVLSDPNGDGSFEERSTTIELDGSNSYDVTGLSTDSSRYRIEVELSTSDITTTPTVDGFSLSV